jgi:hypothetical protein
LGKEYKECWNYFTKDEGNQSVRCQIYFKSLQCKTSLTSGLHRHLEHVHGIKRTKTSENNADEPMNTSSKKQRTILQYVKGQNLEKNFMKNTE